MGLESLGFKRAACSWAPLGIIDSMGGAVLLAAVGLGVRGCFGAVASKTPRAATCVATFRARRTSRHSSGNGGRRRRDAR